ncbi:MAG: serine/threonine-protein kinase [Streptosporangiaceae bacterium]
MVPQSGRETPPIRETPPGGETPPVRETPPVGETPVRETLRRWDPERIGPYVVLGRLGSGSMGQVYLGRSSAGRLVAVKTIKVELAEDAGFRHRFAQEVAAARKVSGVFTASVVEADPEADLPWLATAYVAAPSLARLVLACGPLPVTTVRWLAAGCAEALESIHGAGLVHRDLKPSNVLVAPDGPRVIDFGVARAAERMGRTTSRGAVGTPAYMAPEQARDTHEASVASDVYSLGATLLFAATGHPPYSGVTVMDVLARLATEEPDLSGLPGDLTELITACMHRVPRQRPTSSAMLAQLGDFTEAQAGPDEEHAYLPEAAMALIGEYQRSPQLAAFGQVGDGPADDATAASYTELPASYKPVPRRRPGTGSGPGPGGSGWRRWLRSHLAWAGWASAGAALVVVGVILGAALSSSSVPTSSNSNSRQTAGSVALPLAPPVAPNTVCGTSASDTKGPALCMLNQSEGSVGAAWIVQGRGFAPGTLVAVSLTWNSPPQQGPNATFHRTATLKPAVAANGTLRLNISQLFPGSLKLGRFTVEVTGPDGSGANTMFIAIPPGA